MTGTRVRFVLVRPRNPLNIGACARAMANFGLNDLFVADAHPPIWAEASAAAPQGEGVLAKARSGGLDEALEGCSIVVGTTVRRRDLVQPIIPLPGLAKWLSPRASRGGRVAVLFGNEKTGLTNEELSRCQALVRVPTRPEAPSMNLGQAAATVAYELARPGLPARPAPHDLPTAGQQKAFTGLVLSTMDAVNYASNVSRPAKAARVRRLLNGGLSRQDLAMLQALLRRKK